MIEDGLILMVVKDGIIYPAALNEEQQITFKFIQNMLPQPIRYIKDSPLGVAVNLAERRGK
jgi:hypothetical protein